MRRNIVRSLTTIVYVLGMTAAIQASVQNNLTAPAGSEAFGTQVAILPNGNIVVTDPLYDAPGGTANAGAVHLFSGTTLSLISTLSGSTAADQVGNMGVTVLPNGNYLVRSTLWDSGGVVNVGAVTFCDAAQGCAGVVSALNSLIGGTANDNVGNLPITILNDGDAVVRSTNWDRPSPAASNAGAVTLCSASTGCPVGAVSSANSLIGGSGSDFVGNGGIVPLSNGNYVVRSASWDNASPAASDAGAVSFCSGSGGCSGAVSAANSLVGTTAGDQVGVTGVTALTNGDYIVRSAQWDNGAAANVGAVTFCSGASGCTAILSLSNSLVGASASDGVGNVGVTELSNGNYVVLTNGWDDGPTANVGAVTWCPSVGCTGMVTAGNSLIGSTASDLVGSGGAVALPNGNYVVRSTFWDNGSVTNAGAATFCDGGAGCTGTVSASNSLVGSSANDNVGSGSVTFLANSRYAVSSPNWDNGASANVGMLALCDGTAGCSGPAARYLGRPAGSSGQTSVKIGASPGDSLGSGGITPVASTQFGSVFVTASPTADVDGVVDAGIVAIVPEFAPSGPVTRREGLYGTNANDRVGFNGSAIVSAGSRKDIYAISSTWNNARGAITRIAPNKAVTTANSLTGSSAGDCVGGFDCGTRSPLVYDLGPRLVVASPNHNGTAGAVTLLNSLNNYGAGQAISSANSVVGAAAGNRIGDLVQAVVSSQAPVQCLQPPAGSDWYKVESQTTAGGVVVFGASNGGTVGNITTANAVVGTGTSSGLNSVADRCSGKMAVGFPVENRVSIYSSRFTAISDGVFSQAQVWNPTGVPGPLDDAIVPNGRQMTLDDLFRVNAAEVDSTGSIVGGSPTTFLDGTIKKNFQISATYTFPLGTTAGGNRYTPVEAAVTDPLNNASLTFSVSGAAPSNPHVTGIAHLAARWEASKRGDLTADLTFGYPQQAVNSDEGHYYPLRIDENSQVSYLTCLGQQFPHCVDSANNTFFVNDLTQSAVISAGIPAKTDYVIYRRGAGPNDQSYWYTLDSLDYTVSIAQFGIGEDKPVYGDYNGDGRGDLAVWRPSEATWYIAKPTGDPATNFEAIQWGIPSDRPVPDDYDGDGRVDPAVFRGEEGRWYVRNSSGGILLALQWGIASDRPVPADYNGDGNADIGVYRDGTWFILECPGCPPRIEYFGLANDIPMPGDFNGDGTDDLAVRRPFEQPPMFYILDGLFGLRAEPFGLAADYPLVGDFDSDTKEDIAVWRNDGNWWVSRSSFQGVITATEWGQSGDFPVSAAPNAP